MESFRKRLLEESTCSICLEHFTDPVTLDCGHNFCQGCITKMCDRPSRDATCPQCREVVQPKRMKPNKQMANITEIAKEMSLVKPRVVTVEEAAQECKNLISGSMEIMRKERENIFLYKAENEKESQHLLKQMELGWAKTTDTFRKLHQFLEDQEKLLLLKAKDVEKEIVRRRDEYLSGELSSLDRLMPELEKLQQQSADDLLKNFGNVLERCPKKAFTYPVAFPVELKWKVHDFCDDNHYMEFVTKLFQDSLKSGFQLYKERVTLDPGTAHPQLILSGDLKRVRWSHRHQDLPNNPQRFDCMPFVLGSESFSSGTHFWDVAVGPEEEWSVGVARASVRRKGSFDAYPETGFWDLGKWEGKYRISNHPFYSSLHLTQKPKKIRVTVDCVMGRVAFFNADTGGLLLVYTDASLCGETLLPFFYVEDGGRLTLCS